ncbi:MAG: S8 family peptidase, partial [Bacteriovoracia bacterium]
MKNHTHALRALCLSLALAAAGSSCAWLRGKSTTAVAPTPATNGVIAGTLLIQLKSDDQLPELRRRYAVSEVDRETRVYRLKDASFGGREREAASELQRGNQFEIVEPEWEVRSSASPRDPLWGSLWGLRNLGQDAPNGIEGKPGADIGALEAWKITQGSRDILVAVVDSGVDYTHPDLKDNIWVNEKEANGTPGVDDDGNGYVDDIYGWNFVSGTQSSLAHGNLGSADPMDDNGHGTHVAGTIGASGNNGVGVTGVNWKVKIIALKFLSSAGSGGTGDEYRAIRYAIKQGVDVINASYGGGGKSKLIEATIREAGRAGLLFVAAAGNDSENNDTTNSFPANYPLENILSVAATDNLDQLASFSNFGYEKVHLAAPGVAVLSTYPLALDAKEGAGGYPYRAFSGTSMATPHVVGAAALTLAARPELRKQPAALKKALLESSEWLPQLAGKVSSGGRLNLARAVRGQKGSAPAMAGGWVEEAIDFRTPRYPTEAINQAWAFKKAGAQAIQLHVQSAVIDRPNDAAILFDSLYRPILELPADSFDQWLPAVVGDTAYLKFSNGLVAIQKYLGSKRVKDMAEVPDALVCQRVSGSELLDCYI